MKTLNARTFEVCFCFEKRFLILLYQRREKALQAFFFYSLQNYYTNRYIKIQFAMTSDSESESDDEEYNQGPDIFEAAADEEIKEDHLRKKRFFFFPCLVKEQFHIFFTHSSGSFSFFIA